MPFDPTPTECPAISSNGVELAKLRMLEQALREPMPKGFEWYFLHCQTCAMGLSLATGIHPNDSLFSEWVGLSAEALIPVFSTVAKYGVRPQHVTPIMVADAIAAIIRREEADTAGGA